MQPHRSSALGYASAASAVHSRVYGACTAEAAASESSRLSVGGCIRSRRYFGPHPVQRKKKSDASYNKWGSRDPATSETALDDGAAAGSLGARQKQK